MKKVLLADIKVGDRFRKDYGDLEDLADSIRKFGLLQPVVIDRNKNLIAGGRRCQAAALAGLDKIDTILRDEVDELTAREIELEENVRRRDLTWSERARLTAEIDRLKREKYGSQYPGMGGFGHKQVEGWGIGDTATALDLSKGTVSLDLYAARMLDEFPDLEKETDRKAAFKKVDHILSRLEREKAQRSISRDSALVNGDCRLILDDLKANSIDVVVMDPPYGTGLINQQNRYTIGFDDSQIWARDTLESVLPKIARIARENAHVYCFTGSITYPWVYELLDKAGLNPDHIPLIWDKGTGPTTIGDWTRRYANVYEMIIFCNRNGERRLDRKRTNVLSISGVPIPERVHTVEKPEELIRELLTASTQPGEFVLDPFMGTGRSMVAAKQLGLRYLGIEENRDLWNEANVKVANTEVFVQESDAELSSIESEED